MVGSVVTFVDITARRTLETTYSCVRHRSNGHMPPAGLPYEIAPGCAPGKTMSLNIETHLQGLREELSAVEVAIASCERSSRSFLPARSNARPGGARRWVPKSGKRCPRG